MSERKKKHTLHRRKAHKVVLVGVHVERRERAISELDVVQVIVVAR